MAFFFCFWPVRAARQHAIRALSHTVAAALVEEWNIHTFWPGFLLRFQMPTFCHPLHLSNDDQNPADFSKINSLLGIFNCLETELKDPAASPLLPGKPLRPGLMPSFTGLKSQCVPVQRWLNSSGEKAVQSQGHMALTAGWKLSGLKLLWNHHELLLWNPDIPQQSRTQLFYTAGFCKFISTYCRNARGMGVSKKV